MATFRNRLIKRVISMVHYSINKRKKQNMEMPDAKLEHKLSKMGHWVSML